MARVQWIGGVAMVVAAGCGDPPRMDGSPWGGGVTGSPATGGSAGSTTAMETGGEDTAAPPGSTTASDTTAVGSTGGSGPSDDTTGSLGDCPAPAPVVLSEWTAAPWVAPDSGDAQVSFRLSTENWLHYRRFELDLDIDVTQVGLPYNCFLELRNTGANQGETYPWRYFSVCVKNEPPRKMVHVVYAAVDDYLTTDFTLQENTSYHVNVVFDSLLDESSLTMTPVGGSGTTIVTSPLTSSITPMGQGLDLWVGFRTSHPDYPTILPPWGWSFSNLEVTLEPGGPFGPLAPGCP